MADAPVLTNGNTLSPMARAVRRLVLLDRARTALGGAACLADILGIGRRAVNHKLAADRGLSAGEIAAVSNALDQRAAELSALANDMRAVAA